MQCVFIQLSVINPKYYAASIVLQFEGSSYIIVFFVFDKIEVFDLLPKLKSIFYIVIFRIAMKGMQ